MADNSRPVLSGESILHFHNQGLTPEQRRILFRRRCQGDSIQEILADNPTISAQAAAAEIEAVERHGDRDIPHLQKTLLDEIGGEKEQDFLRIYPSLKARYQSMSAEFKANGRLSMAAFYDLFQLVFEIGIKCGRFEWMLPMGQDPPTLWEKIKCVTCGEPIGGVAVDASTSFGKEVLNQFANRSHSQCPSFKMKFL
jgi:hypothetical protein